MPGFQIPTAGLAAAVAQNAGQAAGQVDAYKDQVARQAKIDEMLQQQRQFDTENKRLTDQFEKNFGLQSDRAKVEKGDHDAIQAFRQTLTDPTSQVLDPNVPGAVGYTPSASQQQATLRSQLSAALKVGDMQTAQQLNAQIADMEGAPMRAAQLSGQQLENQARTFQNSIAPTVTQLNNQLLRAQVTAAQNDTPGVRAALQANQARLQASLQQQTYAYEKKLDAQYALDPTLVSQDLIKVSAGVQTAAHALQTPVKTGNGMAEVAPIQSPLEFTDKDGKQGHTTLGSLLGAAQQEVLQSTDPLRTVTGILTRTDVAGAAIRANPEAMTFLTGVAMQRNLMMRLQGQKPGAQQQQQPAAPAAGIKGLDLSGGGLGSMYGGGSGPFSFGLGR